MGTKMDARKYIRIRGANENNLKNIDVDIPRNELVVLTGLSGSGKSSLAFDTIYAEGQRRYMESLSSYARQFLGNPYEYGGNSLTNGIDCSGFTQQIYAAFGVSLGRTDTAQASAGVEIPLSPAQAGDLVVYYGPVGIYNGSGGLIHASSPSVEIIESPSCTYRQIRCVRRVL